MSLEMGIGAAVAVGVIAYLLFALFHPESF